MRGKERAKAGSGKVRGSRALYPRILPAFCFLLALGAVLATGSAQDLRAVEGRVIGANDQPLRNAVVYIENQKSMEVKTYITTADGKFRFGELSSDVDYQVWARVENHKSKTKSISSFDSKKQFDFDLKVDTQK